MRRGAIPDFDNPVENPIHSYWSGLALRKRLAGTLRNVFGEALQIRFGQRFALEE